MTTFLFNTSCFIKTLFQHVWMSVSSIKFYQNVFLNYRGLGVKYIIILNLISTFCACLILLNYTENIKQYLEGTNSTPKFANIDYIFQQLPILDYDGNSIAVNSAEEPIFIKNMHNQTVIAIDHLNKIIPEMRIKIPIIMNKEKIIINLLDQQGKAGNSVPIEYSALFGNNPQILTKENIKSNLLQLLNKSSHIIPIMVFPLLLLFNFFHVFWENIFLFAIILLFIKFSKSNNSMSDGVRVILFSNGFFVLFQFILLLGFIELNYIIWIVQTWSSFLMIVAVIRSTPKFTMIRK